MKPRFGDLVRGIHASESNPQRLGYFVERRVRDGRVNPGPYWRVTDGRGNFWEYPECAVVLQSRAPDDAALAKDILDLIWPHVEQYRTSGDWPGIRLRWQIEAALRRAAEKE